MISLRNAFGRETTTKVLLQLEIPGRFDDDNRWVTGGYGAPMEVYATPLPLGDTEHGTHGKSLKADAVGERTPATMRFMSLWKFPINSIVVHNGDVYKIIREGDYSSANFWASVGTTRTDVDLSAPLEYPEGMTVLRGKTEVPVSRLLRLHGR